MSDTDVSTRGVREVETLFMDPAGAPTPTPAPIQDKRFVNHKTISTVRYAVMHEIVGEDVVQIVCEDGTLLSLPKPPGAANFIAPGDGIQVSVEVAGR